MEIFRKALQCALAHEKNKTAIRTRRTYKKHITVLEQTIVDLKSMIVSKDSNIAGMGTTIHKLNAHLDNKKSEIEGLEGDLQEVKTALEDKDKVHFKVLQKLNVQSNLFNTTRKQLGQVTRENEDQSNQIWRMLEENCFLNKRILELDLEVHSLETLLCKLKSDLEKAEHRSNMLGQTLKHSQEGYELKSREVISISAREQQLRATVMNLQGELDQWKRDSKWMHDYSNALKKVNTNTPVVYLQNALVPPFSPASPSLSPVTPFVPVTPFIPSLASNLSSTSLRSVAPSPLFNLPAAQLSYAPVVQTLPLQLTESQGKHSTVGSTSGSTLTPLHDSASTNSSFSSSSVSPSTSPSISPSVSPPTSPLRAATGGLPVIPPSVTSSSPPHSISPLLTPLAPSNLSYTSASHYNSYTTPVKHLASAPPLRNPPTPPPISPTSLPVSPTSIPLSPTSPTPPHQS